MWPFNKGNDGMSYFNEGGRDVEELLKNLNYKSCADKGVDRKSDIDEVLCRMNAEINQLKCNHDNAAVIASPVNAKYHVKCPDCEKVIRESNKGEYLRSKYDQAKKELNKHYESKAKIKAGNDACAVRETIPKQL